MKIARLFGVAALGTLALAAGASAETDSFKIDPEHTNILFIVNHLGYSRMIGQFQDFGGQFTFDDQAVENSAVEVTVKTESVDTDHQARDDDLRSPDFFNAVEFPDMTFKSTKVEKTGEKTGKITGDLTLLGVTKPVTLDVTFNQKAPHPLPGYNGILSAGFSATAKILRSDFGMKTFVPAIGDEIDIILEVEGQKI